MNKDAAEATGWSLQHHGTIPSLYSAPSLPARGELLATSGIMGERQDHVQV